MQSVLVNKATKKHIADRNNSRSLLLAVDHPAMEAGMEFFRDSKWLIDLYWPIIYRLPFDLLPFIELLDSPINPGGGEGDIKPFGELWSSTT